MGANHCQLREMRRKKKKRPSNGANQKHHIASIEASQLPKVQLAGRKWPRVRRTTSLAPSLTLLLLFVSGQLWVSVIALRVGSANLIDSRAQSDEANLTRPHDRTAGAAEVALDQLRLIVTANANHTSPSVFLNGGGASTSRLDRQSRGRDKRDAHELDGPTLLEGATADLLPGSRVVAARVGQPVEFACNALDATLVHHAAANQMTAQDEQQMRRASDQLHFLVGFNGSLWPTSTGGGGSGAAAAEILLNLYDSENHTDRTPHGLIQDDETTPRRLINSLNVNDYLVALIFWYKDAEPAPIYTLDARSLTSQVLAEVAAGHQVAAHTRLPVTATQHKHQRANLTSDLLSEKLNQISQINRRLLEGAKHYRTRDHSHQHQSVAAHHLNEEVAPTIRVDWPLIWLRLARVSTRHAGDFRCRVDFRRARTIRQTVRLLVEEPLHQLELRVLNLNVNSSHHHHQQQQQQQHQANKSNANPDNPTPNGDKNLDKSLQATALRNDMSERQQPKAEVETINLDEGASVALECGTTGGWPRPRFEWLVARSPSSQAELLANLSQLSSVASWWRSAHIRQSNWTIGEQDNWASSSSEKKSTHESGRFASGGASRLELRTLGRQVGGLRLGCRAVQVLQLDVKNHTAPLAPNYRLQPAGRSQGANLIHSPAPPWASRGQRRRRHRANIAPMRPQDVAAGRSIALAKWVQLELNLRPELVEILRENVSLASSQWQQAEPAMLELEAHRAGTQLVCRAHGSLPDAQLSWFWSASGGAQASELIEPDELVRVEQRKPTTLAGSESEIEFAAGLGSEHNQRVLTCRATNERLSPGAPNWLEVSLKLDVKFGPIVRLIGEAEASRSASKEATHLEGAEMHYSGPRLTLHCQVQSNPAINQLVWLVNGRPLARLALINGATTKVELFDQAEVKQATQTSVATQPAASSWIELTSARYQLDARRPFLLTIELVRDESAASLSLINSELEFRCLASSGGANGSAELNATSEPLVVPRLFDDSQCRRNLAGAPTTAAAAAPQQTSARPLDSVRAHQVGAIGEPLQCLAQVGTRARFLWTFVPAEQLTEYLAGANVSAHRQLETQTNHLEAQMYERLLTGEGLISCQRFVDLRAQWQRAPCRILLLNKLETVTAASTSALPDVQKCALEPVVLERRRVQQLALHVNCNQLEQGPRFPRRQLIFAELTARWVARDNQERTRQLGAGTLLLDEPARNFSTGASTITMPLFRKAAAAAAADHHDEPHHRPLADFNALVAPLLLQKRAVDMRQDRDYATANGKRGDRKDGHTDESDGKPTERKTAAHEGRRQVGDGGGEEVGGAELTLDEQVALLNELEFAVRLGDLVDAPSEWRTIQGAQLAHDHATSSRGNSVAVSFKYRAAVAQVSRSAAPSDEAEFESPSSSQQTVGERKGDAIQRTSLAASHRTASAAAAAAKTTTLLEWGRRHEIGITLAAIGATLVLSALTLTLIVLVLRVRRPANCSSSSAPSSLSTVSTAMQQQNHNHNQDTSPSSSATSNSTMARLEAEQEQASAYLRATSQLTGGATSSVSSFSSPPPPPLATLTTLEHYEQPAGQLAHVLDLRHLSAGGGQSPLLTAGKQLLQFDYNGLILMDNCEHEFLHPTGGHLHDSYNLNGSLQESCASTTETTTATPITIDFLAPPATSCHHKQATNRLRFVE